MAVKISAKALETLMAEFQNTHPTEAQGVKKYTGIFMNDVYMAAQFKTGTSLWAQWLRQGWIKDSWVVWAWEQKPNGRGRKWLGIRLDSGNDRPIFIDLTTDEGQKKLKDLEAAYGRFLNKEARALVWAREVIKNINARALIEKEGWTLKIFENAGHELVESEILYGGDPDEVSVDLKNKVVTVFYL